MFSTLVADYVVQCLFGSLLDFLGVYFIEVFFLDSELFFPLESEGLFFFESFLSDFLLF